MGKGERGGGGEIRDGVRGEVSKYKNTLMPSSGTVEIFFQSQEIILLTTDDDSGLSAI